MPPVPPLKTVIVEDNPLFSWTCSPGCSGSRCVDPPRRQRGNRHRAAPGGAPQLAIVDLSCAPAPASRCSAHAPDASADFRRAPGGGVFKPRPSGGQEPLPRPGRGGLLRQILPDGGTAGVRPSRRRIRPAERRERRRCGQRGGHHPSCLVLCLAGGGPALRDGRRCRSHRRHPACCAPAPRPQLRSAALLAKPGVNRALQRLDADRHRAHPSCPRPAGLFTPVVMVASSHTNRRWDCSRVTHGRWR